MLNSLYGSIVSLWCSMTLTAIDSPILQNVRRSDLLFDRGVRYWTRAMSFVQFFRACIPLQDVTDEHKRRIDAGSLFVLPPYHYPYWRLFQYLGNRLVTNNFIDHTRLDSYSASLLEEFLETYKTVKDYRRAIGASTGNRIYSKGDIAYIADRMATRNMESSASSIAHRLYVEFETRTREGWFMVMDTLTVSDCHYKAVFQTGNTYFRDYVRQIRRDIGKRLYGSVRAADAARARGQEFHSYFAVVEAGSRSNRLHYHVIHFMRCLPQGCRDPNNGNPLGVNSEISRLKHYWKYGYSTPKAIRFHEHDAFGRLGWCWPCKHDDRGRVIPRPKTVWQSVASYVIKYVSKSISTDRSNYPWRTRMSKALGLQMIKRLVQANPQQCLTGQMSFQLDLTLPKNYPRPNRRLLRRMGAALLIKENLITIPRQSPEQSIEPALALCRLLPRGKNFFTRLSIARSTTLVPSLMAMVSTLIESFEQLNQGIYRSPEDFGASDWQSYNLRLRDEVKQGYDPPAWLLTILKDYVPKE